MVMDYIRLSSRMCHVIQLVNIDHGLKSIDQEVLSDLLDMGDVSVQLVLTKADKLNSVEEIMARASVVAQKVTSLAPSHDRLNRHMHVVSGKGGMGIPALRHAI